MSLLMWTDEFALSFWLVRRLVLEVPSFDLPVSVTVQSFPMLLMIPLLRIMMYFFCCLSVLSFSIDFASVRKLITRAGVVGRPVAQCLKNVGKFRFSSRFCKRQNH